MAKRKKPGFQNFLPLARWAIAIGILAFGYETSTGDERWARAALLVYSIPLIAQFARSQVLRFYGLWFGVAIVAQTLISFFNVDYYITRQPNTVTTNVYMGPHYKPGITGTQVVTTDEMGFRVLPAVDYYHKKAFRIFAIGGSTTEDSSIDDHLTWTHLLQEKLTSAWHKPVEVINTGVAGVRARNDLALLRHIQLYKPDLVIFLVGANDWVTHMWLDQRGKSQIGELEERPFLPERTLLGRALSQIYGVIAQWLRPKPVPEQKTLYWADSAREPGDDSLSRPVVREFKPEKVFDQFVIDMNSMADLCDESGFKCLFLTNPSAYSEDVVPELRKKFWMTPIAAGYTYSLSSMIHLTRLYNGFLVDWAVKRKLPLCDIAKNMRPTVENFYDDDHFNISGDRNVSEKVAGCVLQLYGGPK